MSIRFLNKSHSGNNTNTLNIFVQEDEPVSKDGIWLQGDYEVENILADENVFASEEWKNVSLIDIPYNFKRGSAICIKTDVYMFGGTGNNVAAYKYNTLTDTYTQLTSIPFEFQNGSVEAIGDYIYLFGGDINTTTTYKYNILTDTYTQLTNIPYDFISGMTKAIGTNIYLFGGQGNTRKAYKYDTLNDIYISLSSLPYDSFGGSVVNIGNNIYIFGSNTMYQMTKAYKYNVSTDKYTELTNIPYNFRYGASVAIGNYIYLFVEKLIYKYDVINDSYTKLDNMSINCMYCSLGFNGKDIFLFGGDSQPKKVQVMSMIPNEYPDKSIVISQGNYSQKTYIGNIGISNSKFYYDRVYYNEVTGQLRNDIPVYNGDGTQWVKI